MSDAASGMEMVPFGSMDYDLAQGIHSIPCCASSRMDALRLELAKALP